MTEHSGEIEPGRISDFGDKDTERIARFLEHSGAPTMAALVRQRWADQQELAAAARVTRPVAVERSTTPAITVATSAPVDRTFSFREETRRAVGAKLDADILRSDGTENR